MEVNNKESKRQDVCKYEIPKVLQMVVGTYGNSFFVHYYDLKKLRESFQNFDTAKEALSVANEVYDKFKRGVT